MSVEEGKKTGLIAGGGSMPAIWLERAQAAGRKVTVYRIEGEKSEHFNSADGVRDINPGRLKKLIQQLKKDGIEDVVMMGKVKKERIFQRRELDGMMENLLKQLPDHQDETILRGISRTLKEEGFNLLSQKLYMEGIRPRAGFLTDNDSITREERSDCEYGVELAGRMAEMEIGQTVLLKRGTVLAVEAVEGTDAAIKRAGKFGAEGMIMAKSSRPRQDDDLEVPAVGPRTVELLAGYNASALALEAGGVVVVEQERMLDKAEKAGVAVLSLKP